MNLGSSRRIIAVLIPLNCVYIVAVVLSALRSAEELRRIPVYMLCVLVVNWVVWRQWRPRPGSGGWKRIVRFCAWVVLLVNVPALGLALVGRPTGSLVGSVVVSFVFGVGGLWLTNAARAQN
jgi:hypothetical protein